MRVHRQFKKYRPLEINKQKEVYSHLQPTKSLWKIE